MDALTRILEATVVTLREGVEAALVVGIVLAYLRKTGRQDESRFVLWGLVAAVAASVAAAVAVQRFGLDPENEVWEGSLMLVAAGLVSSLVIWMWRTGRRMRADTELHLGRLLDRGGQRARGLALFGFSFLMVFREGAETVLFLSALSGAIGANPWYNALGGGLGLLLAGLFGVLLVQGSLRLDPRRFFAVTGVVLLLLAAKLVANGLHEFFEVGLLPSTETLLSVVGFLTRDTMSLLILVLLIGLPAALLLQEALTRTPAGPRPDEPLAEARKRRAEVRRGRLWTGAAGVAGLTLSGLLALSTLVAARGYDPRPAALPLTGPALSIPLAELRAQPMRKYTVSVDGVSVRFFVVRRKEDEIALAFDACAICPPKGYHLVGDHVVCRNCGAPISFETIGIPGGCNPIPLKAAIQGDAIVIRAEDLAEGRARFAGAS